MSQRAAAHERKLQLKVVLVVSIKSIATARCRRRVLPALAEGGGFEPPIRRLVRMAI